MDYHGRFLIAMDDLRKQALGMARLSVDGFDIAWTLRKP
jgi:hypothetical protein